MSERVPIYGDPTALQYVVTLNDGTSVRCHVETVGEEGKYPDFIRRRWIFDLVGYGEPGRHIGPFYQPIEYEDDVQVLVNEWARSFAIIDGPARRRR